MSRWIRSSTLCALLGLGLCLGTSPAKADINISTSPGLPAGGTADPIYTAAFYTNTAILGIPGPVFPTGFVDGAPAPGPGGLPTSAGPAPGAVLVGFTPVVVPNGGFPIPPWVSDTTSSSWIAPTATGGSTSALAPYLATGFSAATSAPQGYFYYNTSFTLASATGNSLTGGLWATDNNGIAIYLNGNAEGSFVPGSTGFISFSSFLINPNDFVKGANNLTFVVFNENFPPATNHESPTGLNVEGAITSVPEPSTLAIAGLGALGMIGYGLRRRKALGA